MSSLMKKAVLFFKGSHKEKRNANGNQNLGNVSQEACLPEVEQIEESRKEIMEEDDAEDEGEEKRIRNKGKLFVGGLKWTTSSKGLEDHFVRFGKVVDAVVMRFPDTLKSRGFGFVTFAEQKDAELALGTSHVVDGKVVDVRAFDSKERKKAKGGKNEERVFLGGLPYTVTEEDLKSFFTRYGQVADVEIPSDRETNKPKGYAFLSFEEKKAAEDCLAEGFVYFRGRRVYVKRAENKGSFRAKIASDCPEEVMESLTDDESRSSASADERLSEFVKVAGVKEFFEEYFQTKPALDNTMNGKKMNEKFEPVNKDVMDLERVLLDLMMSSKGAAAVGDLIDFSDGTNDYSEEEEDDDGDNDDDDVVKSDSESASEECSPSLTTAFRNFKSAVNEFHAYLPDNANASSEVTHLNHDSYMKDSESLPPNSPLPFTRKGSLLCYLCQWRPENGSCESFLAHCKTPAHRIKIRDRFQDSKNEASDASREGGNPELLHSEKVLHHQRDSKKKNDLNKGNLQKQQENQQCQKKKDKQVKKNEKQKEQQIKKAIIVKNGKSQQEPEKIVKEKPQKPPQTLTEKAGKKEPRTNNGTINAINVKMHAFAKGMVSIQPLSENELHCKMCNKVIPKAQNFNTLMKNVSQHLHSKKHLNNLLLTENSLKSALEKKPELKCEKNTLDRKPESKSGKSSGKSSNGEQGNFPKEKEPAQVAHNKNKSSTAEESKAVSRKQLKGSKETLSNNRTGSKAKNVAKAEVPALSNAKKAKADKKMWGNNGENKFVCIPCQIDTKSKDEMNIHLNSSLHLRSLFMKANVPKDFVGTFYTCHICDNVFFGSLYDINQHHAECTN